MTFTIKMIYYDEDDWFTIIRMIHSQCLTAFMHMKVWLAAGWILTCLQKRDTYCIIYDLQRHWTNSNSGITQTIRWISLKENIKKCSEIFRPLWDQDWCSRRIWCWQTRKLHRTDADVHSKILEKPTERHWGVTQCTQNLLCKLCRIQIAIMVPYVHRRRCVPMFKDTVP